MKKALLWLWQAPQHLLALVIIKLLKPAIRDGYYWTKKLTAGLSLGQYVFIPDKTWQKDALEITKAHEKKRHSKQSRITGPLYLIVIGLPSLCGNIYCRIKNDWSKYYKFPWEAWADWLAGIKWVNDKRMAG